MRIVIFGVTGMVGRGVLRECLRHPKSRKSSRSRALLRRRVRNNFARSSIRIFLIFLHRKSAREHRRLHLLHRHHFNRHSRGCLHPRHLRFSCFRRKNSFENESTQLICVRFRSGSRQHWTQPSHVGSRSRAKLNCPARHAVSRCLCFPSRLHSTPPRHRIANLHLSRSLQTCRAVSHSIPKILNQLHLHHRGTWPGPASCCQARHRKPHRRSQPDSKSFIRTPGRPAAITPKSSQGNS